MTKTSLKENYYRSVKGFNDYDHQTTVIRKRLLHELTILSQFYNCQSVTLPTIEFKHIFQKSLGLDSTIVKKEFFDLKNKKNDEVNTNNLSDLVLRPELSSSIVRYLLNKKIFSKTKVINLVTEGNCFRYEQPQKGRLREFYQWNFEQLPFKRIHLGKTFSLLYSILQKLQIIEHVVFEINYLTENQLKKLENWFLSHLDIIEKLCSLCQNRFHNKNFFRILDCRDCQKLFPLEFNLENWLTSEEKIEYQDIFSELKLLMPKITLIKNSKLTRGLDYYRGLVFEIKAKSSMWSQNTLIAGGVYSLKKFSEEFDNDTLGIGFAIGLERLILWLKTLKLPKWLFNHVPSKIMIGVDDENYFTNAYKLQRIFADNQLKSVISSKKEHFTNLLQKSINEDYQWFIWLGREFKIDQKLLIRKIVVKNSKPLQINLPIDEIVNFIKNNSNYEK